MAETVNRGPYFSIGAMENSPPNVEPMDGPSISYQGDSVPNPLYPPSPKDGLSPGRVPVLYNNPYFVLSDGVPQKTTTTVLTSAQVITASVAMSLATAQLGASGPGVCQLGVAIPFVPIGTSVATSGLVLDFGFTTGTTTANSTTVTVVDNRLFTQGQWIVVAGVGNSSATAPLITQVASVAAPANSTTTIYLATAAATALSNVPIGQGNLYSQFLPPGTQFGPATASANAWEPYQLAGLAKVFDPTQGITRNLTVTSTGSTGAGGGGSVLVFGYDIWGNPMTELLTATGTTIAVGKKGWKVITRVLGSTAGTATTAVGIGDVFGFNVRSDKWEYSNIFYNGSFATSNTGWTAAVTTVPSTNTSGDVRGTVNGSTLATIGTSANGTARLTLMMTVPEFNMINATPLNTVPLFGVAQSTT